MADIDEDELHDFLKSIRRMGFSLAFIALFILGEWFLEWLVGTTIMSSNADPFSEPPMSWAKKLSVWGLSVLWGLHVLTELVVQVLRHVPR